MSRTTRWSRRLMGIIAMAPLLAFGSVQVDAAGPTPAKQGTPFLSNPNVFPISVWLQNPMNARAYAEAGINLYVGLWGGPTEEQLQTLHEAGMKVICDQNAVGLGHVKGPTIVGWMHGDEPDNAQPAPGGGYGPPIDPKTIVERYKAWKAKDPTRPVYLNMGQGVAWHEWIGRGPDTGTTHKYPRYAEGADILSFDIYPANTADARIRDNLVYVAKGVSNLRKWSNNAKPVWCWIETTKIGTDSPGRPSPGQVESEVWMAIVHGATGIGYFCHSWSPSFDDAALLHDPEMIGAVTGINGRITRLAQVLNSPTLPGMVGTVSSNPDSPVDIMVKRHAGATWVFAVSMGQAPTTASFTLNGVSGSSATVDSEGRTLRIKDGVFTDGFGPFGVHVYKIAK